MNILMISLDFVPIVGGITAHVYELSKALISLGHQVTVITRHVEGRDEFEIIDKIPTYRIKLKAFGITYGYQINKYIKQQLPLIKPDIIHIHGMRPLEFYNINNIPLAYTNHTSGYLKRIKKGGYRIKILKKLFQKPNLFLAPSKELLNTPFKIDAIKKYIPNGVISDKFERDLNKREKIRKRLGIKEDEILAILTRRLVKKNGVIYLAKATKFIKNDKLKILIIGDGEEFKEIERILTENFNKKFFMLGSKTHDEIIEYYSASDISILPSLMEATSISGLEAMAAGLPLVGTKVGGIPELIIDGVTGYLCQTQNPKDLALKIDKLLKSKYREMGEKAQEIVKKEFDWRNIAQLTIKAYKKTIK